MTHLAGGLLLKMLKYFKVMWISFEFSHVKEVVEFWLVDFDKFSWIILNDLLNNLLLNGWIDFPDVDNKEKSVPVSFCYILQPLWEKNKI